MTWDFCITNFLTTNSSASLSPAIASPAIATPAIVKNVSFAGIDILIWKNYYRHTHYRQGGDNYRGDSDADELVVSEIVKILLSFGV